MAEDDDGVQDTPLTPEDNPPVDPPKDGDGDDKDIDDGNPNDKKDNPPSKEEDIIEEHGLKLADDTVLNKDDLERIVAEAKELDLDKEGAEDLLALNELEVTAVNKYKEDQKKEVENISNKWIEDAKSDKEIGGDALKENVALSNRVIKKYGSKELKDMLNKTRFGDHPEVIRIFSKLGKLMTDDTLELGKQQGSKKSDSEVFFDKTNNEK